MTDVFGPWYNENNPAFFDPLRDRYNDETQCNVIAFQCNFRDKRAWIYFPESEVCDMNGCIKFVQRIQPDVREIYTYSGREADTYYTFDIETAVWQSSGP